MENAVANQAKHAGFLQVLPCPWRRHNKVPGANVITTIAMVCFWSGAWYVTLALLGLFAKELHRAYHTLELLTSTIMAVLACIAIATQIYRMLASFAAILEDILQGLAKGLVGVIDILTWFTAVGTAAAAGEAAFLVGPL